MNLCKFISEIEYVYDLFGNKIVRFLNVTVYIFGSLVFW